MRNLLSLIVPSGQTESVDPRVLAPQQLRVAQNVRSRKDGRASKKYGNQAYGFSFTATKPNALATFRDQKLLVADATVKAKYGSSVAATGALYIGSVARFLPDKIVPVRRVENSSQPKSQSVVNVSGKLGYFWDDGGVRSLIRREDGSHITHIIHDLNGSYTRAVVVGTTVHLVYKTSTNVRVESSDFSVDAPTFGSASTVDTLNAAGDLLEAAPFSGTQWLLVCQTGANEITVSLMTGTTASASQAIVTVGTVGALSVYGVSGENIYVSWVESNGALKVVAFNASLGAETGATATVETVAGNAQHQPQMIRRSSSAVTLIWGSYDTAAQIARMRWASVSNATSVGTITTVFNCRPASKPFSGDGDTTKHELFVHTDNGTNFSLSVINGWTTQRGHFLVTIDTSQNVLIYQLSIAPLIPGGESFLNKLVDVAGSTSKWFTCLPNVLRARSGGFTTEMVGLEAVSFTAQSSSLRNAYRQSAVFGGITYFAGNVSTSHGPACVELGFMHAPVLDALSTTVTPSNGGSVTAGLHYYTAVYEWIDEAGLRHRSTPSDLVSSTTSGSDLTVALTISTLTATHNGLSAPTIILPVVRAHVYRTKAGQTSPFYRVSPNTGTPTVPDPDGASTRTFTDTTSDANLTEEILYTDGDVLPNVTPPACRYIATFRDRLVLGGLFVANKVLVSKSWVEGEPAQFVDDDAFAVYIPEDVTAIAGLDDSLVVFAEEAIFLITGDGPNDLGAEPFSQPHRLPSNVGCIDHRSVVETSDGLIFQSKHGLYLLPRGFGPPVFVGGDVQETLAAYPIIQSATRVSEQASGSSKLAETTIRFLCGDAETPTANRVLVLDMRTRAWSVDTLGSSALGIGGAWDDLYTFTLADCTQSNPVRQENLAAFGNLTAWAETKLGTGDLRPFGVMGWGDFPCVNIAAEYRGACKLKVDCWVDGEAQPTWTYTMPASTPPESAGDVVYFEYVPKVRSGSSIRVDVYDVDDGSSGATEGLAIHAIQVVAVPGTGPRRMPATTHRGP